MEHNFCKYCDVRNFKTLNATHDTSVIEIAINGEMKMLRARSEYGTGEGKQDIIYINYCPICGRKL